MIKVQNIPIIFNEFSSLNIVNNIEGWGISRASLHSKLEDGTYKLQTLDIDFGEICSLHCPHCFKRCFLDASISHKPTLSYAELMAVIMQAKTLGLTSIKILGAGEPFENEEFLKFVMEVSALEIHLCIFTKGHVLGNDELAKRFNQKYGITTAKELVDKLYTLKTSILLGFNSFNKDTQLEYVGLQRDAKFDYYSMRNQALVNLVSAGFNSYIPEKPTRLALVASPYKLENIDEIIEIYKWGRMRNIYVVTCPSTLSGYGHYEVNRFIKKYSIDTFLDKSIEMYTQIYIWSIEKHLMTLDDFIKNGVSIYPGAHPCNQIAAGMYLLLDGTVVQCPGNDSVEKIICNDIRNKELKQIWINSYNYNHYAKDEEKFNFYCIARDNELFNKETFYDKIYNNVITHFSE